MGEGGGDLLCISLLTSFMTEDMIDEACLCFRFFGVDSAFKSVVNDSERSL